MKTLVMIPALGCDAELYVQAGRAASKSIRTSIVAVSQTTLEACVASVLGAADGGFVILGTSFGGRVAVEVALAAPERVKGLVVIGSGAGPVADPAAGLRRSARLRAGEMKQLAAEMGEIISH